MAKIDAILLLLNSWPKSLSVLDTIEEYARNLSTGRIRRWGVQL